MNRTSVSNRLALVESAITKQGVDAIVNAANGSLLGGGGVAGAIHRAEAELLARCYRNCFALMEQHGIKTVAFPSIGTGAYGFPMERAATIACRETKHFLEQNGSVEKVILVAFSGSALEIHRAAPQEICI